MIIIDEISTSFDCNECVKLFFENQEIAVFSG